MPHHKGTDKERREEDAQFNLEVVMSPVKRTEEELGPLLLVGRIV